MESRNLQSRLGELGKRLKSIDSRLYRATSEICGQQPSGQEMPKAITETAHDKLDQIESTCVQIESELSRLEATVGTATPNVEIGGAIAKAR